MRRVLWGLAVTGIVSAAIAFIWWPARPPAQPIEPVAVHFSDLAPSVYKRGHHLGQRVRVAYPLRLHPTNDPLTWEFRPGSSSLPATHRIHFEEMPTLTRTPVVVGTVEGITADGVVRLNNVPGVVIIRGASVVPDSKVP